MRVLPAAALALAVALAACGEGRQPRPASRPIEEAAGTVRAFERAAARRDFRAVCDRLLAAQARRRLGGDRCTRRQRRRATGLRSPRLELLHVALRGRDAATVRVRAAAAGEPAKGDTIELVRERGRFRIASLVD